jgi:hypothetical protein
MPVPSFVVPMLAIAALLVVAFGFYLHQWYVVPKEYPRSYKMGERYVFVENKRSVVTSEKTFIGLTAFQSSSCPL